MIDIPTLIACGLQPTQARQFAEPISAACQRFGIQSGDEAAAFVAQAMHESRAMTSLEEDLRYSAGRLTAVWPKRFPTVDSARPYAYNAPALANHVYGGRMDNDQPGDGWRYRGRGIFQLTGRSNYRRAGAALGVDFEAAPELVCEPVHAALTAAWYWASEARGGMTAQQALRAGDFDRTTRIINGGNTGADERRREFNRCKRAMAVAA